MVEAYSTKDLEKARELIDMADKKLNRIEELLKNPFFPPSRIADTQKGCLCH